MAENGETLDLRTGSWYWRGVHLRPVTNGPLPRQWALLAVVVAVAVGWLLGAGVVWLRRRRGPEPTSPGRGSSDARAWRRLTGTTATVGAVTALLTVAAIAVLPGPVDVGFLGWMAFPFGLRLAFHLPLLTTTTAALLAVLLAVGAVRHWWTTRIRPRDAALVVALAVLAAQLASWHLVAWGC